MAIKKTNPQRSPKRDKTHKESISDAVKEVLGNSGFGPIPQNVNTVCSGQGAIANPRQLSKAAQLGEDLDNYNERIKDLVGEIKYTEDRLADMKTRLASYRLGHLHALRDFDRQTQQFIGMP